MEHQKDPRHGKDDEEETGDPSQTERKREPKTMAFDLCRKDVKKETNIISNERSIGHDGCAYCDSPISKLVPREKISCVTQSQGKDEKANSDHPIKLPGGSVGTRVEYPDHMEEDCHNHPMSRPSMQIS